MLKGLGVKGLQLTFMCIYCVCVHTEVKQMSQKFKMGKARWMYMGIHCTTISIFLYVGYQYL